MNASNIWVRRAACALAVCGCSSARAAEAAVIVVEPGASALIRLAAREVRRHVYARTGELLPVETAPAPGRPAIRLRRDDTLDGQSFRLKTESTTGQGKMLTLSGGSDLSVLYAAYRFAEALGVRFYLHGDVTPDRRIPFAVPELDETHTPLFQERGLLPFHDFTQGPDWWEADDYKLHFSQMVKLRMNVMGLHCYPESAVGPEPLVWIGHPDDVDENGKVAFSYPSFWNSTMGSAWGHAPTPTGRFAAGAARLFEEDDFGPSVTRGHRPKPATPEASNEVFERAAGFLREVFGYGRELGVKIALGTETPLHIPQAVQARLREKGLDPASPDVQRQVYVGMFTRIARAYPIDYYWLWTPESWTWNPPPASAIDAAARDIGLALAALEDAGRPFGFGTCGWELGPPQDRGRFDRLLPPEAVMSCINRNIGFNWVDREFVRISDRPKWAIPWLEDDGAMVLPQLWAGRVRRDAADALSYGCTGLLGIHWRTKILAPNVAALAQAAWSQKGWNPEAGRRVELPAGPATDVRVGGQSARSETPVAGTEQGPVYQTCRYGLSAYRLAVPNGTYTVTLQFAEIAHEAPERRVFGVSVQGTRLAERLDLTAVAGRHVAHTVAAEGVRVTDGVLTIDFHPITEYPLISGIVIDGMTDAVMQFESRPYTRRINCGGGAWEDYEPDLAAVGELPPMPERTRDLPAADFYQDLCAAWFGPGIAADMAEFFTRYDGDGGAVGVVQGRATMPRPVTWLYGPGAIVPDRRPWAQAAGAYAFVDELAALRGRIQSAGDRERFDYWLNSFRYLRALAEAACARGALDVIMERVQAEGDAGRRAEIARAEALPARVHLARAWERMMTHLLAATNTPGELGTIANLEQSTRTALRFVEGHDGTLTGLLGRPLEGTELVSSRYEGEPRLIVPTPRTVLDEGETPALKVWVLDNEPPASAELCWRALGEDAFEVRPLRPVARGVYEVTLPATPAGGAEYFVRARTAAGRELLWPATAPVLNHTLVQH